LRSDWAATRSAVRGTGLPLQCRLEREAIVARAGAISR
jgi:hypothetical protein